MECCDRINEYIERFEAAIFTVNRRLNNIIRDSIQEELTLDQFLTLRYIHKHGSCTASELSETFCVNRSATTAITTRLADKQYITRTPDERDRRMISLRLSEKGKQVYETAASRIHERLEGIIRQLPQTEIEQFLDTSERLLRIITQGGGNER